MYRILRLKDTHARVVDLGSDRRILALNAHTGEASAMSALDPASQVGLMLGESILHVLVEEGVISKEKVLELLDGVIELAREVEEIGPPRDRGWSAVQLLEAIAQTFALKGSDEINSRPATTRRSAESLREPVSARSAGPHLLFATPS